MPKQNKNANRPNHIIKDMYLEINNIAQGINIGIFVLVLATPSFYEFKSQFFSTPLFAIASLIISVIFWTRYYFDTEILDRSYTVFSAIWFFCYLISQGVSISLVNQPANWFLSTGVFLFFGAGFYALNIIEIRRKLRNDAISIPQKFVIWQWRRLVELSVLSVLSIAGRFILLAQPANALPAAIFSLVVAVWQLIKTHDYRKYQFIETGI